MGTTQYISKEEVSETYWPEDSAPNIYFDALDEIKPSSQLKLREEPGQPDNFGVTFLLAPLSLAELFPKQRHPGRFYYSVPQEEGSVPLCNRPYLSLSFSSALSGGFINPFVLHVETLLEQTVSRWPERKYVRVCVCVCVCARACVRVQQYLYVYGLKLILDPFVLTSVVSPSLINYILENIV